MKILKTWLTMGAAALMIAGGIASAPSVAAAETMDAVFCNERFSDKDSSSADHVNKATAPLRVGPAERCQIIQHIPSDVSFDLHCFMYNDVGNTWTYGRVFDGSQTWMEGWIWDGNLAGNGSLIPC
ncbi:hypothetical protein ACFZAV_45445 [Streptomyces sp. NPDC008343]|uniref:hypothetical protein n=1 Tax=Streptomyces sp. NPDC008343 TaxID=3364828 RepID=UPI0036EA80F9